MKKDLKKRFKEDPDQALIDELLDVIDKTSNPSIKFDAIKMICQIRHDPTY